MTTQPDLSPDHEQDPADLNDDQEPIDLDDAGQEPIDLDDVPDRDGGGGQG